MKQEKQRITKYLETIIYGMTGMVFATAFFFGILYPDMGIANSVSYTQEGSVCLEQGSSAGCSKQESNVCYGQERRNICRISDLENTFCRSELRERKMPCKKEDVIYASYFYECLTQNEP